MRKALIATASVVLGAGLMVWIWGPDSGGPSDQAQDDLARARAFADAVIRIERLRKRTDGPVDWEAIRTHLKTTLGVIRKTNRTNTPDYEKDLAVALRQCATGNRPDVNQQIIAKGLQHVAVLAIRLELDVMARAAGSGREAAAKRAAVYFEAIRPTFARRDKDFFPDRGALMPAADAGLRQVLAASRLTGTTVAAGRQFEEAICRTYALSVLYEVKEIERLRHSDRAECEVKRTEAQMFYRIISPRIRKQDAGADAAIWTMLRADYDAMSVRDLKSALKRGLGRIPLR